jgi:ATP-dependent Clp protease ATP-binding subunit ClpC
MLAESASRLLAERKISYVTTDDVAEHLLEHGGFDASLGARPMRGAVQRMIEGPIADRILSGDLVPGTRLRVSVADGELQFDPC